VTDKVTVTFAADTRNVALARTVAAAMAARADLPLDQLEDVRLAVDEAVTQVLLAAVPGADVTCTFLVDGYTLQATVAAPTQATEPPSTTTFSWTVLAALVDSAHSSVGDGVMTIGLTASRGLVDV
jgi:serine/threonine-protein kinase RsbW